LLYKEASMRTGRPTVAWILTNDERQRLESLAHRSRSAPHVARRARIILACAEGTDSGVVARRLHVTPATVCKWRGRFVRHRLDGLYDEPRPGAKRTITDEQVEQVVIRTLETTPRGATHWSTRDMGKSVGLVERRTHDYTRHGTTTLFAALNAKTSEVITQFHQRHRSAQFREFLDLIEAHVPRRLDVHLIMDNYSTHKTGLIRTWFAKRPRFHVHFTPTYGSWLSLVERWFAELTMKQIRRGTFRSVPQLKAAIQEFIEAHQANPKPFVWIKSADEILASIARFAQRTVDARAAQHISRTTVTGH
jgi:transposase